MHSTGQNPRKRKADNLGESPKKGKAEGGEGNPKKKKASSDKKKPGEILRHCHCKPTCGKKLTKRGRREHYAIQRRLGLGDDIKASETNSSDSDSDALIPSRIDLDLSSDDLDSGDAAGNNSLIVQDLQMDSGDDILAPYSCSGDNTEGSLADQSEIDLEKSEHAPLDSELDGSQYIPSDSELDDSEPTKTNAFDDWNKFDEDCEQEATYSDEEKSKSLEELLNIEDYAEDWATRMFYFIFRHPDNA